ncbi:MAG: hypothetical protein C0497_16135, partial [Gemmatimonas sp.]|nr:hypothetical protein [Gemmatimonas sp.]
ILAVTVNVLILAINACSSSDGPSSPGTTSKPDTTKVPLTDLSTDPYRGFQGGLYPNGANTMPNAHAALGTIFARNIRPLNSAGQSDANGKIVLLSVGMSNVTQEFCGGGSNTCQSVSFVGQALADPAVDRTRLVIVDGVTAAQVQAVWLKQATPGPTTPLPATNADAYTITAGLGPLVRTLKVRYPNLQIVFLSSRIYAGYAAPGALAGDLRPGVAAPWLSWGPYLWANGTTPRSDGLTWVQSDFASDNTHPNTGARQKVGALLLGFMKSSPHASCWFLSGRTC